MVCPDQFRQSSKRLIALFHLLEVSTFLRAEREARGRAFKGSCYMLCSLRAQPQS